MENKIKYPIGDQDFKSVRDGGFVYVDKTRYIRLLLEDSKYYFLARPRRFGKSLFLSTLRYFFEGRRYLFEGLEIASSDWDWEEYPVLRLDLNTERYAGPDLLEGVLESLFRDWEARYGVTEIMDTYPQRFKKIIEKAHEKTGKQVVILVDEYDKPLVGNLHNDSNFEHYRAKLAGIYSNFKSSAEHIRLVFLTGVSRFSKLSVFSDLNNINDITFDDAFADICGITEKELHTYLHAGIEALAVNRCEEYEEVSLALKKNYDGYRFTPDGSDIYNPWSLLCCLQKERIGNYWNATGAATVVAEALRDADVDIEYILNADWDLNDLAGLDLLNADPTALLYQAGYLTIADYDPDSDSVRLKIPNREIRKGLFNDLLKAYLKPKKGTVKCIIDGIRKGINSGEPDLMMKSLDAYLAGIPYDLKVENENNFQNIFYVLTTLIGIDAKAEAHTSAGRVDLLIETPKFIYIIELKYDSSPAVALRQIGERGYARKFAADPRRLFRIGVGFSSANRCIQAWEIESDN